MTASEISLMGFSMTKSGSSLTMWLLALMSLVAKTPHPFPGDGLSSMGAPGGMGRRVYAMNGQPGFRLK